MTGAPELPAPAATALAWDARRIAVARMALSQMAYCTDTGEERALIADMLADLAELPGGREQAA